MIENWPYTFIACDWQLKCLGCLDLLAFTEINATPTYSRIHTTYLLTFNTYVTFGVPYTYDMLKYPQQEESIWWWNKACARGVQIIKGISFRKVDIFISHFFWVSFRKLQCKSWDTNRPIWLTFCKAFFVRLTASCQNY